MKKDSTQTGATLCSSMRPRSATTLWLKFKLLAFAFMALLSINQVWGATATLSSISTSSTASSTTYSVSHTFDDVTCTVARAGGQNNPGFYTSKGIVRYYSNDVMTLSVPSSSTISQIEFTMYSGSVGTASPSGLSGNTWTGSANSVSFTGGGTVKISSITVTYSSGSSKKTVNYSGQKSGHFQPSFLALSQIVIWGFFAFFCKKVFHIRCTKGAYRMHLGSLPSSQPLSSPFGTLFVTPPFFLIYNVSAFSAGDI